MFQAGVRNDSVYHLELVLERDTMVALQNILDNVNFPLRGRTIVFLARLKALQRSDAKDLNVGNPFPFLLMGETWQRGVEFYWKTILPIDYVIMTYLPLKRVYHHMMSPPKESPGDVLDILYHCEVYISLLKRLLLMNPISHHPKPYSVKETI